MTISDAQTSSIEIVAKIASKPARRRRRQVSPAELRAGGVVELGRAPETSALYVLTIGKLYLFHAEQLPDRALDAYAVELAVSWIENGTTGAEVASNLDVSVVTLRNALLAAGYDRLGASQIEQHRHARSTRRLGNRRGRLVRSGEVR